METSHASLTTRRIQSASKNVVSFSCFLCILSVYNSLGSHLSFLFLSPSLPPIFPAPLSPCSPPSLPSCSPPPPFYLKLSNILFLTTLTAYSQASYSMDNYDASHWNDCVCNKFVFTSGTAIIEVHFSPSFSPLHPCVFTSIY